MKKQNDLTFYSGKKVLLTGHTGFKGSWMSCLLLSLGAEVTGFSLEPPTTPSLFDSQWDRGEMRAGYRRYP